MALPFGPMEGNHTLLIQDGPSAWLLFRDPSDFVRADSCSDVDALLQTVEQRVAEGMLAAGFLTYEASPGTDSALCTHEPGGLPVAWFGFFHSVEKLTEPPCSETGFEMGEWTPSLTEEEYRSATDRIRDYIRAGDTYQVNYTIRLNASFEGDPYACFLGLCRAQRASNCAFIRIDDTAVCCASPELFFRIEGSSIEARPMKGTVARGMSIDEDRARAEWLRNSEKNRAENIMIVDMVRNDIGRVAEPGSVHVPETYSVERYPTVFQMTSSVRARTSAAFSNIVRALFPCASITGAPKVRTMQIINELEPTPRGIYTGSIGYVGQGSVLGAEHDGLAARFNVAIRTVAIDTAAGAAEYGVGGGIVWDSEAVTEYEECLTKAAVLVVDMPEFRLLETILWEGADGFFLLDRHMARIAGSAEYFGYDLSPDVLRAELSRLAGELPGEPRVVRVLVDRGGGTEIETRALPPARKGPFRLGLAPQPVTNTNPFLYHKTTHRTVYEDARKAWPECDDVILQNERGEVTETSIANLVLKLDGELVTPPVSTGLLAGTFRDHLLESGEIRERVILVEELERAEEIHLVNSVRKWVRGEIGC